MNTKKRGPGRPKGSTKKKVSESTPEKKMQKTVENIFDNSKKEFFKKMLENYTKRLQIYNKLRNNRIFLLVGWLALIMINFLLFIIAPINFISYIQLIMIGFGIYGFIDVAFSISFMDQDIKFCKKKIAEFKDK